MNRQGFIGGSDIAAIMGVSRYKTRLGLFLEKTGVTKPQEENRFTHWGRRLEAVVAQEFGFVTKKRLIRKNGVYKHKKYPFLTARIDRGVAKENAVLEVKTASQYKADEWNGKAPFEYILQLQYYLMITGADNGYFACLIGGNDFRYFKIERDDQLIAQIERAAVSFWEDHIIPGIPPAPTDGDNENLLGIYTEFNEDIIDIDSELENLIHQYLFFSREYKAISEKKEDVSCKIKGLIGHNNGAKNDDYKAIWTRFDTARIDVNLLRDKYPEIANEVTKSTTSGKLTITDRKK